MRSLVTALLALGCSHGAPSTPSSPAPAHHKVAEVDAFGTVSLVQQKCWRWDSVNDWPPFYVHQDVYDSVDRCGGGARSRDVQWDAGLRQSLLAPELFDPLQQNNDDCPYERTDVDCTGFSNVLDVVKLVNVAFKGHDPATTFCDGCTD